MFARWIVLFSLLLVAAPAWAGKIAVVDFQRAVTETTEGKAAQTKLDTMMASKKSDLDKMQADFQAKLNDYDSRALILSPDAKKAAESDLQTRQQKLQQTLMQYQNEMQQTYMSLLQDLDEKMRTLTEKIAKEKGYDLVLDRAVVVYMGGDTVDMTDELIKRYNAK
jgi:outer membrane protein